MSVVGKMDFIQRCLTYINEKNINKANTTNKSNKNCFQIFKANDEVKAVEYKAAGCLFTDGKYVLGGVQRKKRVVSGLGGSRKTGETYIQTALRELVEELFEVYDLCVSAYDEMALILVTKTLFDDGYINLVYSFKDLEQFLHILYKYDACLKTELYATFPLSVNELIYGRTLNNSSEVAHLMLCPIIDYDKSIGYIAPVFLNDMAAISSVP
jgi:hypothetical protein